MRQECIAMEAAPVIVGADGIVWYYTKDERRRGGGFVTAFPDPDNPACAGVDLEWLQRHNPDIDVDEDAHPDNLVADLHHAIEARDGYLVDHLATGRLYERSDGETTESPIDATLERCGVVMHAIQATPRGTNNTEAAPITVPVALTLNPEVCSRVATSLGRVVAAHVQARGSDQASGDRLAQLDRHVIVSRIDIAIDGVMHRLQVIDLYASVEPNGLALWGEGRLRNGRGPDTAVRLSSDCLAYSAVAELAVLAPTH